MVRSSSFCVLCGSVLVVRPAVIHNVIPAAENVVSLPLGSTSEKMGMEVGLAPGEGQGTGVGSPNGGRSVLSSIEADVCN